MNIFISGGCKNGKSYYAQRIAKDMADTKDVPLYYLATMISKDEEDEIRIKRHISERAGWGFDTIEQGEKICDCLTGCVMNHIDGQTDRPVDSKGVFLLDSVTALLSNEMFMSDGKFDFKAADRVASELVEFAIKTGNTVFVSDYIYSDSRNLDSYTEKYRKGLATVDKALAQICDKVIEVAYGNITNFK